MQSKDRSNDEIFAEPLKVDDVADCYFYHTMELPGHGVIEGLDWDLRGRVDEYLGNVDFAGQRVLEIGPASGFLTFEMEKRGADVISVEVTDEHGWDFVPYPAGKIGRSIRSASNCDATVEEFLLVQSRRPAIQSQSVLWRCLQFACGTRTIRHRRDGSSATPLPRSAPDRRAMRKTSEITRHCRDFLSGPGRRAGLSPGADAREFPLAYVVAFQHAILHTVSGGDGFHDLGAGHAPAVSPRTSAHAFHSRRRRE